MNKRLLFLMLISVFFIMNCRPPKGWKKNSYIYNQNQSFRGKQIRVKLHHGSPQSVSAIGKFLYTIASGKSKNGSGQFTPRASGEIVFSNGEFRFKGKRYAGILIVKQKKKKVTYINQLPLEQYIMSVAGHEMNKNWHVEALKAQAVVARTYAMYLMRGRSEKAYHVDSTTNHQVYGGIIVSDNLYKAISSTEGKVIYKDGKLVEVFFHSSCGGHTASSKEVWGSDHDHLQSKKTKYCRKTPSYKWSVSMARSILEKKLRVKRLFRLKVLKRTASKRVASMLIASNRGKHKVTAKRLRNYLGATKIKSTMFDVRMRGGVVEFSGRGYGHGVGMCQWGAKVMAEKYKKGYKSIVKYYFPGVKIQRGSSALLASL